MWQTGSYVPDADVNIDTNDSDSGVGSFAVDDNNENKDRSAHTPDHSKLSPGLSHLSPWIDDEVVSVFVHAICLVDDVSVALAMPFVDVLSKGASYISSFRFVVYCGCLCYDSRNIGRISLQHSLEKNCSHRAFAVSTLLFAVVQSGRQESDEKNPNPVLKFADDRARGNGAFLYPRTNGMEVR